MDTYQIKRLPIFSDDESAVQTGVLLVVPNDMSNAEKLKLLQSESVPYNAGGDVWTTEILTDDEYFREFWAKPPEL